MTAEATIALRLGAVDQLIDLHDVSPFRDGDPLRPEAADYIMRHARRLPRNVPIRISVSLPGGPASAEASRIAPAIAAHFTERVAAEDKVMAEHMADSTRATLLGLLVLGACLLASAQLYATLYDFAFIRLLRESLGILGWVAIWKPIEMLVHERLPIARRRALYRRLATAECRIGATA
jgi:hypothetical protein